MIHIDYQKNDLNLRSFLKRNLNKVVLKNDSLNQIDGFLGAGLPESIIEKSNSLISIFMPNLESPIKNTKGVRSLNLSVACGIAIYEAHKQLNFQNDN